MRRCSSLSWVVSGCLGLLVGIAAAQSDKLDFNLLSKVTPGMDMLAVVRDAGPPSDMKGATYYYKHKGRVVFEGSGTPEDKTKVLRVEQDVTEDGIP